VAYTSTAQPLKREVDDLPRPDPPPTVSEGLATIESEVRCTVHP